MNQQTYPELIQQLYRIDTGQGVTRGSSSASVFSQPTANSFMKGFDITVQLQVGCPGGCAFCYVRGPGSFTPPEVRANWGYVIKDKERIRARIEKSLEAGELADKTIYWSGVTDAYGASKQMTRDFWMAMLRAEPEMRPRRIAIQTRFRPDRDLDLIREYQAETLSVDGGPSVLVSYSINTDRDDLIRQWEARTPGFESRLTCISKLADAEIFVVATLSPLAPWNDLTGGLIRLKELGVQYITTLFFKEKTQGAKTPKEFLAWLREHLPQVLDEDWQQERLAEMKAVFGSERVLAGQPGFTSLAAPHLVGPVGLSEQID